MIVIDVTARVNKMEGPLKRVTSIVDKMERSVDKAAKAVEKLANAWAKAGAAAGSLPAIPRPSGGGGVGSRPPALPKPPKVPTPLDQYKLLNALNTASGGKLQPQRNQALGNVFKHYQQLAMKGDPNAMRIVSSLAPSVAKMNSGNKGFGHFAMQALMSSRFSVGKGGMQLMPLVGRSLQALQALGGVATGTAGALAILGAGVIQAFRAISSAAEFASRMAVARTTPGSMGALNRMSGFLGGDAAQAARAFGDSISGGNGAAFAGMAGINPYSGPYGDNDVGSKFLKGAQFIANAKSYKDAQKYAQMAGNPQLANLYLLSNENKKAMFRKDQGLSMGDLKNATNAQFAIERVGTAFETFITKVFVKFAPFIERVANAVAGFIEWVTKLWDSLPKGVKAAMMGGLPGPAYLDSEKANRFLEQETDRNTKALRDNTRALNGMREIMGGGSRAQKVLPRNIGGMKLSDPAYRAALEGGLA